MNQTDLLQMLTYRRPAWSRTEEEFIRRYIDVVPDMYMDDYGNRILQTAKDSRVMIACHTDTVHWYGGKQTVEVDAGGLARLPVKSRSNCLGADDTAGVYAALRMIEAGVKATFVFHRAEEIGGRGSAWLANKYPEWIARFDMCVSLDRRGTRDIITHQFGGRTASETFAWSLADAIGMEHAPEEGIFTDSANYVDLIAECSNVSVGYRNEHTKAETLELGYLEELIGRLVQVKWDRLDVVPLEDREELDMEELLDDELEYTEEEEDTALCGWANHKWEEVLGRSKQ